jgi:hypothetical protein
MVTIAPGRSDALKVHVESPANMVIEIVTLACPGHCVTVEAVARGGYPPYEYVWGDGLTSAIRTLCPTESGDVVVSATDSGYASPEFNRDPETVSTHLTAEVRACGDAGAPRPDSGPLVPAHTACITNGSFEGAPAFNVLGNFDAQPWIASCEPFQGADVWNETQLAGTDPPPAASDGTTYVRMYATEPARHESVSQQLCEPLTAGRRYHVSLDLASRRYTNTDGPAFLEIWGGNAACGEEELLWSSPEGTNDWRTHCATLAPSRTATHLTLKPRRAAGEGAVFVDAVHPVAACN